MTTLTVKRFLVRPMPVVCPIHPSRRSPGRAHRVAALACALWLGAGLAQAVYVPYIGNVRVKPRDDKTATIHFDISTGVWRNEFNHGAAWIFFKVQPEGSHEWQPVRLAADHVVNPTGYAHGEGGPFEFVVPAGDDGFTGVILRPPKGATPAGGAANVTVLWDFTANKGVTKDVKVRMRAFGTVMAYVAEGPFYLGSGGTEWNRLYQYTDGSQHTKPYKVSGPGAIPTGRRDGRLWARKGAQPEDGGEIPSTFPNGYRPFYCMVFQITYAQYLGFLNTLPAKVADKYHVPAIKPYYVWHAHAGTQPMRIIRTNDPAQDPFTVERHMQGKWQPAGGWDRELHGMSWADGAVWAAWAGLRPMSELEFEKAGRGLREPVPEETGPSDWGVRAFPGGHDIGAQWPAHRRHTDRAVTIANPEGRKFKGTHGLGTWVLPADWPHEDAVGSGFRGGGMSMPGSRVSDRLYAAYADTRRRPYCSFRCVRTAPRGESDAAAAGAAPAGKPLREGFTLELDPLPDLREPDVAIFFLSGRFRNGGDKPLQVELASRLPAECFPGGAAALALTAPPNAAAPFRILAVLSRQNAGDARDGQSVSFQIRETGGNTLAEQTARLAVNAAPPAPLIGSLEGGAVTLCVTNATDRTNALAVALQPPAGLVMPVTERRVEARPRTQVRTTFPLPRQIFLSDRVCRIPYRVTIAGGAPQAGELAADLRVQRRWWVSRRIPAEPGMVENGGSDGGADDAIGDIVEDVNEVFKAGTRPKGWSLAVHGAVLSFGSQGELPSRGSAALGATRAISPAERKASVSVRQTLPYTGVNPVFSFRLWFNGEVVYNTRPDSKEKTNSFRIRKGANTMVVECRSENDKAYNPGNVDVTFQTVPDGKAVEDLEFDIDRR